MRTIPKGFLQQTTMRFSSDCALDYGPLTKKCGEQRKFKATGVVIGDSHAMSIFNVLRKTANTQNVQIASIAYHSCMPFIGVKNYMSNKNLVKRCDEKVPRGLSELSKLERKPDFAIIYSRWNVYSYSDPARPAPGHQTRISFIKDNRSPPDQRPVFVAGLRAMIAKLREIGVKRILVIAPNPELTLSVPECLARAAKYKQSLDVRCGIPRLEADAHRAASLSWLKDAVEGTGARLIDPINALCDASTCHPAANSKALYFDDDHLSEEGAWQLFKAMKKELEWVLHGKEEGPNSASL